MYCDFSINLVECLVAFITDTGWVWVAEKETAIVGALVQKIFAKMFIKLVATTMYYVTLIYNAGSSTMSVKSGVPLKKKMNWALHNWCMYVDKPS